MLRGRTLGQWARTAVFALAMPAVAGTVPPYVNYQGRLTNASGQPLTTGDYWLKFKVFDAASGGNLIWGPFDFDLPAGGTITNGHRFKVPVVQGYFNVMLGDNDSAAPSPRSILDAFGGADRYVEITVVRGPGDTTDNTSPLSPRQQVLATPFAVQARTAETAVNGLNGVPIGTIVAWHKNLTGTPALAYGWVECNGQVLSDSQSPYNGLSVPDLNHKYQSYHSKGLFLRGFTESGLFENDSLQGHFHQAYKAPYVNGIYGGPHEGPVSDPIIPVPPDQIREPKSDGTNGVPRTGPESRPASFSVVWIIRVK